MYSKSVLSSKAITWPLSAEQHPSLFRCESPAQADCPTCSVWTAQPSPALPMCELQSTKRWLLERAAPAQSHCKGQNPVGQSTMAFQSLPKGANSALHGMSTMGGSAQQADELFSGCGHLSDPSVTAGPQSHTAFPARPDQFLGRCQVQKCFPLAWLILTTLLLYRVA